MPCNSIGYSDSPKQGRSSYWFCKNNYNPSQKSGFCASINSRITWDILVRFDHYLNYNCYNEPFTDSSYKDLFWHMHGLIFETSIWLLAGSTRFLIFQCWVASHPTVKVYRRLQPLLEQSRYHLEFALHVSLTSWLSTACLKPSKREDIANPLNLF